MAPRKGPSCAYTKFTNKVVTPTPTSTEGENSATTTDGAPQTQLVAVKCKEKAQPIMGDCNFCNKCFCSKHRMLEAHDCPGLQTAREQDRERNKLKLESEATPMLRGI